MAVGDKSNPYSYPRKCEKEGTHRAFAALSRNAAHRAARERAIRSYVENVLFGGMSLSEWCKSDDPGRVALSTWRKYVGTDGKLKGTNDAFRAGIEAYRDALSRGRTDDQVRAMDNFRHDVTVALPDAAKAVIGIVTSENLDTKDSDRIAGAKALADWAGANKANEQMAANLTVVQKGYTTASPDDWDDEEEATTAESDDAAEAD